MADLQGTGETLDQLMSKPLRSEADALRELAGELARALASAEKLLDDVCAMVSRAEYKANELSKPDAWQAIADKMRTGFFASYRDEFADALTRARAAGLLKE